MVGLSRARDQLADDSDTSRLCSDAATFSAVLQDKPGWADAFLNKERTGEVAPLLPELAGIRKQEHDGALEPG